MSNVIWDSLFVQGNIIIFKTILAIFNLLKTELMGKICIEEINSIFEENTKYLNDFNYINYYLILKKFEFNYKIIQINRRELEKKISESINSTNRFNLERTKKNKEENRKASFVKNINECYEEWPICIYDNDYKYRIVKYFHIMVHPDKIKILNNYFYPELFEVFVENTSIENINKNQSEKLNLNIIKNIAQSESENSKNNSENQKPIFCCNSELSSKNSNEISCKFRFASTNYYSELDIYKELLIERRPHFCNIRKHLLDSSPRISCDSIVPRKPSFTNNSVDSADNIQNISWRLCNKYDDKTVTAGSSLNNSNCSLNNFTSDATSKFIFIV